MQTQRNLFITPLSLNSLRIPIHYYPRYVTHEYTSAKSHSLIHSINLLTAAAAAVKIESIKLEAFPFAAPPSQLPNALYKYTCTQDARSAIINRRHEQFIVMAH